MLTSITVANYCDVEVVLYKGDITTVVATAIANAANSSLLGGGGVDGAIHHKAGRKLYDQCLEIQQNEGGCKPGHAKITCGGNLPAEYVIHTVGPVWHNNTRNESVVLSNCYKNSIVVAEKHKIDELIFPSIATGIFGYPVTEAAYTSKKAVKEAIKECRFLKKVGWCLFDKDTFRAYKQAWSCENE